MSNVVVFPGQTVQSKNNDTPEWCMSVEFYAHDDGSYTFEISEYEDEQIDNEEIQRMLVRVIEALDKD